MARARAAATRTRGSRSLRPTAPMSNVTADRDPSSAPSACSRARGSSVASIARSTASAFVVERSHAGWLMPPSPEPQRSGSASRLRIGSAAPGEPSGKVSTVRIAARRTAGSGSASASDATETAAASPARASDRRAVARTVASGSRTAVRKAPAASRSGRSPRISTAARRTRTSSPDAPAMTAATAAASTCRPLNGASSTTVGKTCGRPARRASISAAEYARPTFHIAKVNSCGRSRSDRVELYRARNDAGRPAGSGRRSWSRAGWVRR